MLLFAAICCFVATNCRYNLCYFNSYIATKSKQIIIIQLLSYVQAKHLPGKTIFVCILRLVSRMSRLSRQIVGKYWTYGTLIFNIIPSQSLQTYNFYTKKFYLSVSPRTVIARSCEVNFQTPIFLQKKILFKTLRSVTLKKHNGSKFLSSHALVILLEICTTLQQQQLRQGTANTAPLIIYQAIFLTHYSETRP